MLVRSFNTPCYRRSRHDGYGPDFRHRNVCMMQGAYNPQLFWCSASHQRVVGAGVGDGSGAPAGAAAPLGGFGFFAISIFFLAAALGGGPAG